MAVVAVAAVAALGVGHKVTRLEALIKTMMTAMGHLRVSAHMGYGYLYIHKKRSACQYLYDRVNIQFMYCRII